MANVIIPIPPALISSNIINCPKRVKVSSTFTTFNPVTVNADVAVKSASNVVIPSLVANGIRSKKVAAKMAVKDTAMRSCDKFNLNSRLDDLILNHFLLEFCYVLVVPDYY